MRFYGGSPMDWLGRTPLAVVKAMLDMMPTLQAEEALMAVSQTAVGSGTLKQDDAKRTVSAWKRAANQGEDPSRRRRNRIDPNLLPTLGIGYQVVKPKPE